MVLFLWPSRDIRSIFKEDCAQPDLTTLESKFPRWKNVIVHYKRYPHGFAGMYRHHLH